LNICSVKTKEYSERKAARANEDAAIAEAISILNSDEAFAAFGKTDATSTGGTGFIQFKSVQLHQPAHALSKQVQAVLAMSKSARVKKIASMVQKGNPFEEVLEQIEKMLKVNVQEGKADQENLDFCNSERTTNDDKLTEKKNQIDALDGEIEELNTTIHDPETGLHAQLSSTEKSLSACVKAQKTETADRMEANSAYQTGIKNLAAADELLVKAFKVLNKYYDELAKKMEAAGFVQKGRGHPAPP
jgi:predicted RNase H-like nuclease (RuvC/YqgF family)